MSIINTSIKLRTHIIQLFGITVISKTSTVIRELIIAYYFGTTLFKDGFVAAFGLGLMLFYPFVESMMKIIIPKLKSKQTGNALISSYILQFIMLSILLSILSIMFQTQLIATLFPALDPIARQTTDMYISYMIICSALIGISFLFGQVLNAANHYNLSEFKLIIMNAVVIGFLVTKLTLFNIHPLIGGYLIGAMGSCLFVIGCCLYKKVIDLHWKDLLQWTPGLKTFWLKNVSYTGLMIFPQLTGLYIFSKLSTYDGGILSSFDYGKRFTMILFTLFIPTLITPFFTKLSEGANQKIYFKSLTTNIIKAIVLGTLGVIIAYYFIGESILKWIIIRGSFTVESFKTTTLFIWFYLINLCVFGIKNCLDHILIAFRKNKLFAITTIVHNLLVIGIINVFDSTYLYLSIPIGVIISNTLIIGVQYMIIHKKIILNPVIRKI